MLGKLIKYEFKSSLRYIGLIWIAILGMSVIVGWIAPYYETLFDQWSSLANIFATILMILYFALFVAVIVVTIVIVVQRFYKGLLGDEGYLYHTLPVKPSTLLLSKGIVATVITVISGLVILVTIGATTVLGARSFDGFMVAIREGLELLKQYPQSYAIIGEVILLYLLGSIAGVYQMYGAMALGHLSSKSRIGLSVVAYLGIGMAFSILSSIFTTMLIPAFYQGIDNGTFGVGHLHITLWLFIAQAVIQIVILHVLTQQILTKKLNLQ